MENLGTYSQQFVAAAWRYLPSLLLAVFVLLIGWWVIGRVLRLASKAMAHLDVSLRTFLTSLVSVVLKVLLLISVAGMIGIQTTSFVTILGAAGLAVGLALQGSLANFAGGVLILIFKPFRVGDVIEAQGQSGTVKEIQIFNTIVLTPVGKTVILPNGVLSNNTIINVTAEGRLLAEVRVELDGRTDFDRVREVAMGILREDRRILTDPAPGVGIAVLKPGAIVVSIAAHTRVDDNAAVAGSLTEKIKKAFEQNNFLIPQTHTFVHHVNQTPPSG